MNKDTHPTQTTAKELGINTDLAQANNQVAQTKDVKAQIQEQQQIAAAIGHVQKAVETYTANQQEAAEQEVRRLKSRLEKAEQQGNQEAVNQLKKDILQAEIQAENWGTGGSTKRAVDAITNAGLIALSGGSSQSIATAAASPYVNQLIKKATEDYPALNIPTHILWGAVEAELMGGKASTGAISTAAGELGAKYLMEHLYDKKAKLTETERSQVKEIAKALAGVAGGLAAAGQGASAVKILSESSIGTTVANNAVENNFLSDASRARLNALKAKYHRGENLTTKEEKEFIGLIQSDQRSDGLLDKFRKDPNSLNSNERKEFLSYVDRYYIETITGKTASGYKLASSISPVNAKNRFESEYLINDPVPKRDYGHFPFAGTNTQKSQAVDSLPEESKNWLGWRSEKHSRDEDMYYAINGKYEAIENYKESFNGKLAYSVKDGLELGSTIYGGLGVLKGAKKINDVMSNSTKFTLGIAGAGSVGGQLMSDGTVDPKSLAIDLATAYALKGKGFGLTVGGNAASGALNNYVTDKSISQGAISSGIGSAIGYGMGKAVEIPLDKKINSNLTWSKYNPQSISNKAPYIESYRRNIVPNILGVAVGESGNRLYQLHFSSSKEND